MNSDIKKIYTDLLLESIQENEFACYLFGAGRFTFTARDGMGGYAENPQIPIDIIYDFYKNNRNYDIPAMVEQAYDTALNVWRPTYVGLNKVLNAIGYQLSCQSNGEATFKIDFTPIFEKIKEFVKNNKDSLNNSSPYGLEYIIERYNDTLETYGFKL